MRAGTVFDNPLTGQRAVLVTGPEETGGRWFAAEWTIAPRSGRDGVPAHLHPSTDETFILHIGRARFSLDGTEHDLLAGQKVVLPAGVPHIHPWNVGDERLLYTQRADSRVPALREINAALEGLQTIFGLAREGRTDARGNPSALQLAVIGHAMMPGTYLARPPVPVQRALLPIVAGLGRLLGYRAVYPRHAAA